MKLNILKKIALATASVSIVAFGFNACKKNHINPNQNIMKDVKITSNRDAKAMAFVKKMKNFENVLEKCRTTRVDANMQIDSALWNMEALFNTSYTFPERKYVETVNQDLSFSLNVDDTGCVSMNTVADLYDDITNSVREAYANDGVIQDKSLMTVVFEKVEVVGDKASVKVHVVSGRANDNNDDIDVQDGPFEPGDCWYFGEYGGSCDDPSLLDDAAERIERLINLYYAGTPVPVHGLRYVNYGMRVIELNGSEYLRPDGTPYIFNSQFIEDPVLYFDFQLLNKYYNGTKKVILQLCPEDMIVDGELPEDACFVQVDIRGLAEDGHYFHKCFITYGSKILIPEEEIGPARDLLN